MNYDNHPSRAPRATSARPAGTARRTPAAPGPTRAARPASSTAPRRTSSASPARRASSSSARPGSARPAARPAPRQAAKKPLTLVGILKKIGGALKLVLFALIMVLMKGVDGIKALNRQLDRFRRGEASTVVVNSLLGGAALLVVLAIIALNFSGLRLTYGSLLTSMGKYDSARAIAQTAENQDGSGERIDALRRRIAAGLIEDCRYDDALSLLSLVPNDEESARLTTQARFEKAESLFAAGSYADAAALYDLVSHTADGARRYNETLCVMAAEAYMNGDETSAQQLLISANSPEAYIESALLRVTGSAATTRALMEGGFFSAQSLNHLQTAAAAVREALNELPHGKIAAGNKHTVGLRANGTVVAAGDNLYNQCSVSSWSNITMLAAGAWHTVGLRADGTVVATGDNSQGQLNVSEWTDIVMIAASEYDTLGLKSDGTVVTCGMHDYDVSAWRDVTSICGGAYSAGCLSRQGTMRATHKSAQMSAGTLPASLSVCGTYSVGVGIDGSLLSSFDGAPRWTDLVSATASSTGILAITNTGAVKTHFFRPGDAVDIRVDGSVVEIASSGTHHVVLTADGRVYAFGLNDYGQTNVSGWQLF